MLMFSAYIYALTGNPFQWAAQNVAWGRVYRSLDSVVSDRIGFISTYGLYGYASTQTLDFFYLLAVLFALGAVWPVYRRFGIAYAAMLVVNVLPPMAAGGLLSMGRVTSILFPAFMWMGAAVPAASSTRVGGDLCPAARVCRRDVFHVEAVVLNDAHCRSTDRLIDRLFRRIQTIADDCVEIEFVSMAMNRDWADSRQPAIVNHRSSR